MTRHQATELVPVIVAFAQGKEVQRWCVEHDPAAKRQGAWVTDPDPSFDLREKWRVKPPPREWLVVVENGVIVDQVYEKVNYPAGTEFVLVKEVIQ